MQRPDLTADGVVPLRHAPGFIDFHGHVESLGAWVICGWVRDRWDGDTPEIVAHFERQILRHCGHTVFFPRPDLGNAGIGVQVFLPVPFMHLGALLSLSVHVNGHETMLIPADGMAHLHGTDLAARMRHLLPFAEAGPVRDTVSTQLAQPFTGQNTLDQLSDFVRVGLDETFLLPPNGLAISGWVLARPGIVRALRIRSGAHGTLLDLDRAITVARDDVVQGFAEHGLFGRDCGFIAALPDAVAPGHIAYLEVETWRGEIGHAPLPMPKLRGFAALCRFLDLIDIQYAEVRPALAHVVAPAVAAMHAELVAELPTPAVQRYGHQTALPMRSVIVPLHGRIDFMETQLALFSAAPHAGTEYIYILDDPAQSRATQALAESCHERFGIPFTLLLLPRNLGYALANNIALRHARGRHVCFLNSDVFPADTSDWLAALCRRLDQDPALGAIGPLLLYEDGTVQHQGMAFAPVASEGGLIFPSHPRKGLQPQPVRGATRAEAITGACLVMRRTEAEALGGFDPIYAVGDFEDSDLCLRLAQRGLHCAVDHDVRLYHLERRSQAGSDRCWRRNLTLYNAWQHQLRWFEPQALQHGATP